VEDTPADIELALTLEGTKLFVHGELPAESCAGACFVRTPLSRESIWIPWPQTPGGGLASTFDVDPGAWPPGPLRLGVVMMSDARLAIFARPARRTTRTT
jgi:hypothetical protein